MTPLMTLLSANLVLNCKYAFVGGTFFLTCIDILPRIFSIFHSDSDDNVPFCYIFFYICRYINILDVLFLRHCCEYT